MDKPMTIAKEAAKGWFDHHVLQRAAALSFTALFALAPILLLLTVVASMLLGSASAHAEVYARIADVAGAPVAKEALKLMEARLRHSGAFGITIGLLLGLVAGSGLFQQLESAMDVIWDEKPRPGGKLMLEIRKRLLGALALFVVLTGLLALAILDAVLSRLHLLSGTVHIIVLVGALLSTFGFFTIVYRIVPQQRPDWRHAAIAGLVSTVLVALGQAAFALYLHTANFSSAYGGASSLIVLLVWIYYTSVAALTGAEIARAVAK